jgi:hypothetical protein
MIRIFKEFMKWERENFQQGKKSIITLSENYIKT